MIPPRGFKAEMYPLRHRLIYSAGLSMNTATQNSVIFPLIMGSNDMDTEPETIVVNPHNPGYLKDAGPLCRKMSIIDKLRLSLRFNMTAYTNDRQETASGVFSGDTIKHFRFYWRPIFFSFPEKLDAADDDTTTTVAAILALTKDATNEDVVALTTTKLATAGPSDLSHPLSTVHATQVFGDYNYTTNMTMEEHVWDESLFREALMRYTNKGALAACVGRTRTVNLSTHKPFQNVFIDKFVPRSVRRIVPYTYMAIQVHLPLDSDIDQDYTGLSGSANVAHLGIKLICNYHEWNHEFDQDMGSQV